MSSVPGVFEDGKHDSPRVAYLLSHFPAISHTFLSDEVHQVEASGIEVVPIATNSPGDVDLLDDVSRDWARRTTYIKSTSKPQVLWVFATTVLRHPTCLKLVFRTGGYDLRRYLWRFFYLVEATLVVRTMRRRRCRHLHAHMGGPPSTLAWFAIELANLGRARHRRPFTWSLTIHGWSEFVDEEGNYLRHKVASASFVACISDFTRSQVLRLSRPVDWPKVEVVRCGIDFTRFTPRPQQPDNPVPRVVIVGRVAAEKGHLVLVDAVVRLRRRGVRVAVDVVGPDFGQADAVRAAATEAGIGDDVVLHGPATPTDVARLLGAADVFCLPTFAEGLPIVIMEAMARRLPVVTTYIAGIPELAVDGVTASVVPAGNVDALADALQRMVTDADLRERLADGAEELVHRNHDLTVNASLLADRLRSLVGA